MDEHPPEPSVVCLHGIILIGLMTNIYNLNLQQVNGKKQRRASRLRASLLLKMCAVNLSKGLDNLWVESVYKGTGHP